MKDNLLRAITKDGGIIVSAIDSTCIVDAMQKIHSTSAVVSAALGRALTAASLIGSHLKNEADSVTLRINGGGPVGTIIAVSDHMGNVRGCCGEYQLDMPLNAVGKLDVAGVVGTDGTITVIKDMGMKEPYVGSVHLVSGEIAEDVTAYYAESEQTPTVCALGVLVDVDYSIKAAGGFIAQLLPGTPEEDIVKLEGNLSGIKSVTELISGGVTPEGLIDIVLKGFDVEVLDRSCAEYKCTCSREKTSRALASIRKSDLKEIIDEDGMAEMCCNFCNKKYIFDKEELLNLYNKS